MNRLLKENDYGKKNVGIITFYHENYNFGGLLQAYALPKVLKKYYGLEAEQIDYIPMSLTKDNKLHKKEKKSLYSFFYKIIYQSAICFFSTICKKKLQQRKHAFQCFMQEIPHSKMTYTINSVQQNVEKYSIFICGGDQIWNPFLVNRNIEIYTLQFVPSQVKKIAYAPSMAVSKINMSFKQVLEAGLNSLSAVSVREKQSASILKDFVDQYVEVVVDPVLLMPENEWENEALFPQKRKKYILCYLLGESIEQRISIKRVARSLHLPVQTFPHIYYNVVRKCDLFFGDIRDYTSGPREFLGLIKNAEFVITDSFHACVFSMIFETPFVVFERNQRGEKGNMNSRIYDFLEEYHLENQLVTEKELEEMNDIPKVDYTYAHKHWYKRRKESLEYLERALKE